jgi:1-acylglycerone phosphate reductase
MPLADAALDRVRDVFETNVVSVIGLTNAMLPLLLASEGLVVNISSYSDRLPYPFKGVYSMSKAALTAYSRNLSVELAEFNVRVLNVVTSFVQSQGQSGVLEPWPPGSLYASLQGVGQKVGSGKRMTADEYAVHVVTEALRGKGWDIGPWRFFGTREMMRLGSQSWRMFLLEILGEGWKRFMVLRMWPFWKLRGTAQDKKRA